MTREMIELQYRETLQAAAQLEELGNELRRTANDRIHAQTEHLLRVWEGESAKLFREKAERSCRVLLDRSAELIRTADGLRAAAERHRNVELLGLQLFKG